MYTGKGTKSETFISNNINFNNSKEKIMLGITIDKNVTLKNQIKCLCKNAGAYRENSKERSKFGVKGQFLLIRLFSSVYSLNQKVN